VPIDAPLLTAIYRGEVATVRDALAGGASPDAVEEDGFNPLFYAILADNPPEVRVELVRLLVEAGTNVNHHDSDQRWTALAFAARDGYLDVCRILLAAGSIVDSTDSFGNTPLWRATFQRHNDVVALLVENGADRDLKNNHGISPRLLAEDAVASIPGFGKSYPVLSRIFHYLLIVVAIIFIAMKSTIVARHVHSSMSIGTGDYLNLLQAAILLAAAVGSVRFLMKERKSHGSSEG
jgi:hypothetical protein